MAKKQDKKINIDTLQEDIYKAFNEAIIELGYDPKSPADRKSISHNETTAALRQVYYKLFQPDHNMINNQKSILNYSDINQLTILANCFINICLTYNKSLGLMQFSLFSGIDLSTLYEWRNDSGKTSNPARSEVIKSIQEYHKSLQIGLLNGAPVGALAVANNDTETGLEWSRNQAPQINNNTVYYIPSERSGRLNLEKLPD